MITTVLNTEIREVENKIPSTSNLVITNVLKTKISEIENEIPNHDKYITTPEFNKLTAESFTAWLEQADLVNTTDFDNKLTSFNRWITSDKTKHLEDQKKLDSLITKDYNVFSDRIYFTSNDGSGKTFVFQPKLDTSDLKKVLIMFLVENQMEYLILNLSHYIILSWIA